MAEPEGLVDELIDERGVGDGQMPEDEPPRFEDFHFMLISWTDFASDF